MSEMDQIDLQSEVYSLADAGEILRVPPSTLFWWLDGGTINGRDYRPVIRPESTGSRLVNWAEFVEAGLLRQYRVDLGVHLGELREFIDRLRDREGVMYPLAYELPWVGEGHRLVRELQLDAKLPGELWLVAETTDELVMTEVAASFLRRVEWTDGLASGWKPHDDPGSPVRCRPRTRFGRPAVRGVSTEAIVEHLRAGEGEDEVADQFDLTTDEVAWAGAYELSRRSQELVEA